jgi:tetratricopeptide (TPR) repeat protein
MTFSLRPALAGAALVLSLLVPAGALRAENRWDGPPFSADPKALLTAGEAIAKDADTVYLLQEVTHSFEADGRTRTVWHMIERVVTADGVEGAGTASAWWAPWYDGKPVLDARVITKEGTVQRLDPKAVVEATADEEPDMFSDERVLRAPLPGVAAGSIVETLITIEGRSPIAGAGKVGQFSFESSVPIEVSRLTLDSAAGVTPRIANKSGIEPRTTVKDGRTILIFEKGHSDADTNDEGYLPPDELSGPYVAFSTGTSWHDIAQHYGEIVDKQIEGNDLKSVVAGAVGNATEQREVIDRLLAFVNHNIRYAGVEVGDGSIIPRAPRGVLQNKYGDCKDKATLLVALLHTAGIPAHVALLDAGTGFDVVPSLPGADRFNHAIVVVDGATKLWIDPTDEFARAGALPAQDQGRLALIADATSDALTRTPEMTAAENRYLESRTFTLPEEGKAHVVETTEGVGAEDAILRRGIASSDRKQYRESMEKYAKSYYVASAMESMDAGDPHDLTKPYQLKLAVSKSKSGVVVSGDASVAIPIYDIVSHVPTILRDYEETSAEADKAKPAKRRLHGFQFPRAMSKEWRYRITPAAGFVPRTLPQNETTPLGTASLSTEYRTEADGVVVAVIRFDSGKRLLTAPEFEQTRAAISKLAGREQILIGFDLAGQARLTAGDVRGALTEFRKLATLHPKEAQHHIELARALLAGGLGEAARDEARRAITTEPSNARAHAMLAEVLEHDLLGRPFRKGCDVAGAVAELRKAKALDPNEPQFRLRLAGLLSRGDGDFRFGRHAHLAESIEEYRSLIKDQGKEGHRYEPQLMLVLAHAGRWDEVKAMIKTLDDVEQRDLFRILAAAATEGSPAAIRELGAFEATKRRQHAASVAQTLMALRLYPQAADIYELAAKGSPNATKILPLVETLRKTKPYETMLDDSPRGMVMKLMQAMVEGDVDAAEKLFTPEIRAQVRRDGSAFSMPIRRYIGDDATPAGVLDLIGGALEIQQEGSDAAGYRLRMRGRQAAKNDFGFFLERRDGQLLIAAAGKADESVGIAVRHLADAGKLEAARIWLNWARETVSVGGGDDPLSGPPFARLWQKEKQTATAEEIRTAAAALMAVKETAGQAAPLLASARATAAGDTATAIDMALVGAYTQLHDWTKLLAVAEPLAKAHPDSGLAFQAWMTALVRLDKVQEAEAQANDRLKRLPKDRDAMHALSSIAAYRGDFDAAERWARRPVDELTPNASDYNHAAWVALFVGKELEQAIEDARHATSGDDANSGSLHTLAALYAETGRNTEALQALFQSLDTRANDQPISADWFVLGRVAENYGVADAALAAYQRVEKTDGEVLSSWDLTQRRMKGLATTK